MFLNKYRSEITTQPKYNSLDYLSDPTFKTIKRLFLFSFKNGDNDPTRYYFDEYYESLVEIEDFNALTGNKPFFDQPVKTNKNHTKNLLKCQELMIILSRLFVSSELS